MEPNGSLSNSMGRDWSHLPPELLDEIAQRLDFSIDLLRFRSVCSSWRSVHVASNGFPFTVPGLGEAYSIAEGDDVLKDFSLWNRMVYHLSLPNATEGWIIKLHQDSTISHLVNPFSDHLIQPRPDTLPKVLDLIDLQISVLAQEYVLLNENGEPYNRKVIFSPNSIWNTAVIVTTTRFSYFALFKFGDEKWVFLSDYSQPCLYDLIHYKGEFFAIDYNSRLVVVRPDLTLEQVASSLSSNDQLHTYLSRSYDKSWRGRLIEMDGEMLLVFIGIDWEDDDEDFFYRHPIPKFVEVFKLDWENGTWIEVKSLGDRVLFLGNQFRFSAPSSHFPGCEGNCIYFSSNFEGKRDEPPFESPWMSVYNMADGTLGTLSAYPGYADAFWPPPTWLTSKNA